MAKKSTAMKIALGILTEDVNQLPNDFTPESLYAALENKPRGLIYKDEIGGFLENIKKKDYMSGMADVLCQLFDCPDTYNSFLRSHGFNLKDVCFNILGATTPSRFLDTVEPSDFSSGFLARSLIVAGTRTKSLKRRRLCPTDTFRRESLRKQWRRIFKVFHGKQNLCFEHEDSALDYINDWCGAKEAEVLQLEDVHEADLKGVIMARAQDYAFKLSALYEVDSVSNVSKLVVSSGVIHISLESAQKACLILDILLTQLTNQLTNLLTPNDLNSKLNRLVGTIKNRAETDGWTQHRVVLQYMNCSADWLRTLLQTAQQRDLIESKIVGKATYYRVKPPLPPETMHQYTPLPQIRPNSKPLHGEGTREVVEVI